MMTANATHIRTVCANKRSSRSTSRLSLNTLSAQPRNKSRATPQSSEPGGTGSISGGAE
jgi:hypothetical protein